MEALYISAYLSGTDRGKGIAAKFNEISLRYNFKLVEIPAPLHAKNEWCRDYMPVQGANGINVLFKYNPTYLMGAAYLENTIPDQASVCGKLNIKYNQSRIIMDGGAIEVFGTKAIISDRVLHENTTAWFNGKPLLIEKIKEELGLDELIIVPEYPFDEYGHVDGMVRFIDVNQVLVNDPLLEDELMAGESEYDQNRYRTWKENFYASLANAGLKTIPLICIPDGEEATAKGVYMNFLKLKTCIIMPAFSDPENDLKAKSQLEKFFNLPVETIEASKLAEKGGLINCVTWNW